jgi:sn-glycerol 3-phosphate transport system permease protein
MATDVAEVDRTHGWRLVGRYGLLISMTVIVLFPIYTMAIAALKPGDKVLENPLLPDGFTLEPIRQAWNEGNLDRYILNSLIVAVLVTVFQVVTSVLAAYAFAVLQWPGRTLVFFVFLATMLIPLEATLVVNRETVDSLGWINSYQGLAVPFFATAFGIFLMRQVLMGLPGDLRDAATIDGVGHLGFIRHVAVPLIRPTVGALALFSFLWSWNQYLWPTLITTDDNYNTVQSGLKLLQQTGFENVNVVMAGTLIAAVPIAIVLLIFQRQLVRGLTAGAVKG